MFSLDRKKALVTGGSRGIGASISRALAEQGADVAIMYHFNEDIATNVVENIESLGRKAKAFKGDLSQAKQVPNVLTKIHNEFGQIDILVNNAGLLVQKPILDHDLKDVTAQVNLNLVGVVLCIQGVLPGMLDRGWGRIINISSVCGVKGCINSAVYSMTKGGIDALTRSIAKEVALKGVTVNAVAPGATETEMFRSIPEDEIQAIESQIPMGRLGQPREVAAAVAFLASPEAGYITGTVIHVNGGQ